MAKPFASSADTAVKEQTLEVLADGVYALTADGRTGATTGPSPWRRFLTPR